MKKTLLAVAIPAILMSGAAHAQSSVTLYGLIDEGLDYISNVGGQKSYQMVSGETVGSRWGIKGTEDLGGGLSAVFRLENGFNVNTGTLGQSSREFGRQAYVGLDSKQYGTFTLGRQYDATADMWSGFTGVGSTFGDFASHPFDNDNGDWDYRANNSIKYVSPTYAGFQGEVMYAMSNSTNFANNRMYSAAGTYTMGAFSAVAAYMKLNNAGSTTNTSGAASGDYLFQGASEQHIDGAVKWTFANSSNVAFSYSHTDVYAGANGVIASGVNGDSDTNQNSWKFDNFEVNGQYFFTPVFWTAVAYTYTHATFHTTTGEHSTAWNQASLMFDYDLSKRTSVYTMAAYQRASSGSFANVEGFGYSNTQSQTLVRVGLTHHF